MSVNIRDKIRTFTAARQRKITARTAELMAEEMSLRDLRKARKFTQVRLAKKLGVNQDSVSRLERRSDVLISTLRDAVRAMGGDVRIVAEFPDRPPVTLSHLAEEDRTERRIVFRAARKRA
jgi:transcriptional regulator with XRE-family HTH domain